MSVQGSSHDQSTSSTDKQSSSFAQLQPPLHPLLLSALSSIELCHPTQVQKEFIPLALNGNDILARSRTGSGKTLAYALPILQAILESKAKRRSTSGAPLGPVMAIVLVPTRELSEQVTAAISSVCSGLGNETPIEIANFAGGDSKRHKRDRPTKSNMAYLNNQPDVLVSTPARLLDKLRTVPLDLSALAFLVLDEADLMLSYGHSFDDIKSILSGSGNSNGHSWRFPTFYQSFLMSATMTSEVAELKSLVLRNPEVLYVKESVNELNNLTQFSIKVPNEQDKFLLIYVIFRLKLIKGKALVFVNSTDKSYQLKLFLEKFGIRSGVLNSELPFNSRYHAVQEFNKGVFDYLIATDESEARVTEEDPAQVAEPPIEESTLISTQPTPTVPDSTIAPSKTSSAANPKKRKNRGENWHDSQDKATDYGVSRGVNFVNVACVINFDLPLSTDSYTHRIGRTARAGRTGIALSFVLPDTKPNDRKPDKHPNRAVMETEMWQKIEAQQTERGSVLNEYKFDMAQVEGFRYRMEDGLRSVTKAAVREARIKEIKHEVLNSIKLKSHFDENPNDYLFLKHDKPLHPTRIQAHMKHVPSYLIPKISSLPIRQQTDEGASQGPSSSAAGTNQPLAVGFHKKNNHGSSRGRGGAARGRGGSRGASGRGAGGGRKKNPLKSFSAR